MQCGFPACTLQTGITTVFSSEEILGLGPDSVMESSRQMSLLEAALTMGATTLYVANP